MPLKQVHFRIERELWNEFIKIFPYKGEPSAFLKRCVIGAITYARKPIDPSDVIDIVKQSEREGTHGKT